MQVGGAHPAPTDLPNVLGDWRANHAFSATPEAVPLCERFNRETREAQRDRKQMESSVLLAFVRR
jgi:hypothetical protein